MRKQKTKQSMMGISLLAVMGIALLAPGAGMNEVKATSTPSDVETETDVDMINAAPSGSVAIDSTTFPDNVFREWVELHCDKNSDGSLSEDEILQCTAILVNNAGITSLEGIEFFPYLRELSCNNNNISSLNVSNNTALTRLFCSHNNLNSLDVSNNTALTHLSCNDNSLNSLDLSNNTALKNLFCIGNNLSSLDVHNNTTLAYLNCRNNNLSSLNVSNNTALTYLYCEDNNLSSLNVSNNTALTDLNCGANNLSSLNVSNNTALKNLSCEDNNLSSLNISNNTALTMLLCSYNNISQLDVSKIRNLEELYCSGNALCSLDLSKNTNLSEFGDWQTVSVPMYKNGNEYYIDLSKLPLDLKRVSIDEAWMTEDGTTYNSTSGRINLSDPKDVGDTVRYSYETNGPASLSNTKMAVTLEISEVRDITEPTTEEPTTEQPTTEQPSTEQPSTEQPSTEQPSTEQPSTEQPTTEQPSTAEPVKVEPAPTQTDTAKAASPKTGDTAPLYPVIFLLLVSFAGGVTLYIRRKQQ